MILFHNVDGIDHTEEIVLIVGKYDILRWTTPGSPQYSGLLE